MSSGKKTGPSKIENIKKIKIPLSKGLELFLRQIHSGCDDRHRIPIWDNQKDNYWVVRKVVSFFPARGLITFFETNFTFRPNNHYMS